jgi:DNA-binding transcriptional regulator GbsR (MarR family)
MLKPAKTKNMALPSNQLPEDLSLSQEELLFCAVIEELVEQWGFKRLVARVWSLLYLRRVPLNQSQIEEALGLSKGNVNGLLQELLRWGVAQKVRLPNDRNYYYEVDKHIWKSVAHVIQARELRILNDAIARLGEMQEALQKADKTERIAHQIERAQHVQDAIATAQTLTQMLVGASPEKLARVSKIVSRLRNL